GLAQNGGGKIVTGSTVSIFGLPIENVTLEAATNTILEAAAAGRRRMIFFVNAHCVNVAAEDLDYLQSLQSMDGLYADGSGMALAARLVGTPLVDNPN